MIALRVKIEIEHITRGEDAKSVATILAFNAIDRASLAAVEDAFHEVTSYCERLIKKEKAT